MKKLQILLLGFILLLNQSCIHTKSVEQVELNIESSKRSKNYEKHTAEDLTIESLMYSEGKLPLEDFFKGLLNGKYKDAIDRIDFAYKPAPAYNKVLRDILKEGYLPVYVRLKNNGSSIRKINEGNFSISSGILKYPALAHKKVPEKLESFNTQAALANAYNMSVGVVTTAILVVLLAQGASTIPIGNATIQESGNEEKAADSSGSLDDSAFVIFNDTKRTTVVSYGDYLLKERTIEPGQAVEGLMFFKVDPALTSNMFKLEYRAL